MPHSSESCSGNGLLNSEVAKTVSVRPDPILEGTLGTSPILCGAIRDGPPPLGTCMGLKRFKTEHMVNRRDPFGFGIGPQCPVKTLVSRGRCSREIALRPTPKNRKRLAFFLRPPKRKKKAFSSKRDLFFTVKGPRALPKFHTEPRPQIPRGVSQNGGRGRGGGVCVEFGERARPLHREKEAPFR